MMTTALLALLAAYYACDVEATAGRMESDRAGRCSAIYDDAKAGFLAPEERPALAAEGPGAASRAAFRRFRVWEAENKTVVERLREDARLASKKVF